MATTNLDLPLIDLDGYINPQSEEDKQRVIAEVRDACHKFGFFQIKNHGIPLEMQKKFLGCLPNFFSLPKDEKWELSYLKSPGRRGYEASGDSLRDGDALPDAKEVCHVPRYMSEMRMFIILMSRLSTLAASAQQSSPLGSTARTYGPTSPPPNSAIPSGNTTKKPHA